jgi:hypothetical protein
MNARANTLIRQQADAPSINDLSFVRFSKKKYSYWNFLTYPENYVEATRTNPDGTVNDRDVALYCIGCDQGKEAAREYLALVAAAKGYVRANGGILQHIVLDILEAPRDELLHGRIAGFFATLDMEGLV